MQNKKYFTWRDDRNYLFYDGHSMVKIIIDACNPDTKVGVQGLRNKIAKTKSSAFEHDITKMLQHVSGACEKIVDLGGT